MYIYIITEQTFQIDPRDRPVIDEMISQLEEIAAARGVNLHSPLTQNQLESQQSLNDGMYLLTYLPTYLLTYLLTN